MRIACLDNTASDRMTLESFLDQSFRECRKSVGHLVVARLVPISKEELLLNTLPDCVVIGTGFSVDESLLLTKELRSVSSDLPIFVFLTSENCTVKNLKRFSDSTNEVFSITDLPSKFIFKLTTTPNKQSDKEKGFLFALRGVKGGVGVTSLVGGIAHSIQDQGKSVVVIDMSLRGEFLQFCLADKWQSSILAQLVSDCQLPETEHLDKIIVELANGIPVVPPPSGAEELRELWLRDPKRLEVGLSLIELLLEKYDVVIVDLAHSEGIFPFAIECRADVRLFISANDPGSVHLLTSRMNDFSLPVEGHTKFLINQVWEKGLTQDDILDFVAWSKGFEEDAIYPQSIPYDNKASVWMGTGNTLFTESSLKIQKIISNFVSDAIGLEFKQEEKKRRLPFANTIRKLTDSSAKKFIPFVDRQKIPYLPEQEILPNSDFTKSEEISLESKISLPVYERDHEQNLSEDLYVYEPPKLQANEK